jgi:hypothetical protein
MHFVDKPTINKWHSTSVQLRWDHANGVRYYFHADDHLQSLLIINLTEPADCMHTRVRTQWSY